MQKGGETWHTNATRLGGPPKYKSVEEIQGKIDAYFTACKGHPLMNPDTGEPFQDKYGLPIIVDAKPPTVSGLALALGFPAAGT